MPTVKALAAQHWLERLREPYSAKALERILDQQSWWPSGPTPPTVPCRGEKVLADSIEGCTSYDRHQIPLQRIGGL
jgi:hypothetical protein